MQLVEEDSEDVHSWRNGENAFAELRHIAGVDISFNKECPSQACAMLVVLVFPSLEVVHVCSAMVEMVEPYIPGYLAFREVEFIMERLGEVQEKYPHLTPQVILVDGNGTLHPRGKVSDYRVIEHTVRCVWSTSRVGDKLDRTNQHFGYFTPKED